MELIYLVEWPCSWASVHADADEGVFPISSFMDEETARVWLQAVEDDWQKIQLSSDPSDEEMERVDREATAFLLNRLGVEWVSENMLDEVGSPLGLRTRLLELHRGATT